MSEKELRELDAEVAEKAMGWKRCPDDDPLSGCAYEFYVTRESQTVIVQGPVVQMEFQPTCDPADALHVLKKCTEKLGCEIHIELLHGSWFVLGDTYSAKAETLELAICRFSVKLFEK